MTGRRMLAVLSVLVVASASSAVWAAPRSMAYHDLIQYPLACACDMHVVVSPRGDQIFVAQGTRLLTIASGLCGVLPVRTSAEHFGTPNYVSSLVTDGATCFVSTGSTLRTYQTTPCWRLNRAPTAQTRLSTNYTNRSMVQVGNTLYVTGGGWFYIYDVSRPTAPKLWNAGCMNLGGNALDLAVEGTYAFLSTPDGFRVVDVSDKTAPSEVATRRNSYPDLCHGIAAFTKAGKIYVLLTRGSKGLFVYEFKPTNQRNQRIILIGSVKRYAESPSSSGRLIGITYDVAVLQIAASTYALIGTSDGLYVADVTPPNTPSVVGCLLKRGVSSATAGVVSIAVRGTTAYLAQAWLGVQVGVRVVDVSRPVGAGTYED